MNRRQLTGLVLVVALTAGVGAWAWSSTREAFQHPPHQALFPTCESCHQVQPDGVTKPDPSFCSACHNGQTVRTVSWTPTDRGSNLDFDHATVLAAKEGTLGGDFPCESCHQAQGGERMDVVRPAPELCYACHAPGKEHQVEGACETCHFVQGPTTIVAQRAPVTHTETFAENHKAAAAANTLECQTCHVQDQCSSCHTSSEAVTSPARNVALYHPVNFVQRHSAPAFSRETECATCHNPEAFCRDCHSSRGLSTQGRTDTGFHSRKPLFEFGHGMAARQALESCVTCHAQSDCLICHSALGGRGVNPHGREFEPERLRSKSPATCLLCHTSAILNR
jgi:predicted CXXCH cytochrome family protein